MNASVFLIGYHGCDLSVAKKVVLGGELQPSGNKYDWLGNGIYFWENDEDRAFEWAKYVRKNPRLFHNNIKTPCVVGALIGLNSSLDLTLSGSREEVALTYRKLKEIYRRMNRELPENKPAGEGDKYLKKRELDCLIIDAINEFRIIENQEKIAVVRAPFLEGESLYPGASFMNQTHIQICVKDKSAIKGYFIPRKFKKMLA